MINDLDRLRSEYVDRKQRLIGSDIYSVFNPSNLFMVQQRQRTVLHVLRQKGFFPLLSKTVLEMGCGSGGVLLEFLSFGAKAQNLYGVDLMPDRLFHARERLLGSHFANADGQDLPFPSHSFHLVLQFTALSSILDDNIRKKVATDMHRVTRSDGLILWYDFWLNPANPQTRGIRPGEIRELFPGCRYEFHRITLAPPITRRLASISWILCLFLESLKIFNTHYLVAIHPQH